MTTIQEKTETDKAFEEFTGEMKLKLDINQSKKGDSWKHCDLKFLEHKLDEEISEYKNAQGSSRKAREATDIANICMMLNRRHFEIWLKTSADRMFPSSQLEGDELKIPEEPNCRHFRGAKGDPKINVCSGNEPYSCRRSKKEHLCHIQIEKVNAQRNRMQICRA